MVTTVNGLPLPPGINYLSSHGFPPKTSNKSAVRVSFSFSFSPPPSPGHPPLLSCLSFSIPSLYHPHFLPPSIFSLPLSPSIHSVCTRHTEMRVLWTLSTLLSLASLTLASPYRDDLVQYNINTNQNASSPLDYTTSRSNTTYTPSPKNWRALPVYTVLLDKFADGEPSNNDYFGTMFEHD